VLDTAWRRAEQIFRDRRLGIRLLTQAHPPKDVFAYYWADDLYMIAASEFDAATMFEVLSSEIKKLHLTWKPGSLEVLPGAACSVDESYTHTTDGKQPSGSSSLKESLTWTS
jgi:hypothetical protein